MMCTTVQLPLSSLCLRKVPDRPDIAFPNDKYLKEQEGKMWKVLKSRSAKPRNVVIYHIFKAPTGYWVF